MQDQANSNQAQPGQAPATPAPVVGQSTSDQAAQPAVAPAPAADQAAAPRGKYKVEVIREKCISAASCVHIAGKTFKLDDENLAVVIGQNQEADETILLGAQSCPTGAIIVTDTETGEQVWPQE